MAALPIVGHAVAVACRAGAFSALQGRPAADLILRIDQPIRAIPDAGNEPLIGRVTVQRRSGVFQHALERLGGGLGVRPGSVDVEFLIDADASQRHAAITAVRPAVERDRQVIVLR